MVENKEKSRGISDWVLDFVVRKSIWMSKGAKNENYVPQEKKVLPQAEPRPRPTNSGPTHGTLPAGFKPTSKPQQKPVSQQGVTSEMQSTVSGGTLVSAMISTERTVDRDQVRRKKSLHHLTDNQITDTPSSTTADQTQETRPNHEMVKLTKTFEAMKRLRQIESWHIKKLESIKDAIEQGLPISQRDLRYLKRRYEKSQKALEHQDSVEWTKETIEKLLQSNVGEPEKINLIKELLEDEAPVPEYAKEYLQEVYRLLRLR